jgi:hypothetical protein
MALRSTTTTTTTEQGIVGHGRQPLALAFLLKGHLRRRRSLDDLVSFGIDPDTVSRA